MIAIFCLLVSVLGMTKAADRIEPGSLENGDSCWRNFQCASHCCEVQRNDTTGAVIFDQDGGVLSMCEPYDN